MAEFHKQLLKAMDLKGITQTELCKKTNIPKSAMSQYMSGKFKPKQKRTYLLAKALDVNEAWLMGFDNVSMERGLASDIGWTDSELSSTLQTQSKSENVNNNDIFSNHEKKVINAYRNKPEMQPAVDKLLGLEDSNDEYVTVLTAARSNDNRPIELHKLSKEQLKLLKNAKSVEDESDL